MSTIGEFLRELRGKMSLREASEKSGLSHSYIRYLEKSSRPGTNTPINPTPDTLKALAKAYKYNYRDLMKKAGYMDEHQNADPEHELLEGIDLELSDDELLDRFNLVLDGKKLNADEAKEIITYLRVKRSMKESF